MAKHFQEMPKEVRRDIQANLRNLERRIERLRKQAVDVAWNSPELRRDLARLTSVRGVGKVSALQILAEVRVLPEELTPRQWVAHAGLDPRRHQSGESIDKPARISRVGNRRLRAALFMPAMVACRFEPHVKAYYEHLLARGKKPMQAIVAVMRKLLHAFHGMLRTGTDFDGEKFYAIP